MTRALARLLLSAPLLFSNAFGCAAAPKPPSLAKRPALRVLHTELPRARAEAEQPPQSTAPRIGAPGGNGAGARRVTPAQSGNDAVGGRPAGSAGIGAGRG